MAERLEDDIIIYCRLEGWFWALFFFSFFHVASSLDGYSWITYVYKWIDEIQNDIDRFTVHLTIHETNVCRRNEGNFLPYLSPG
jgi:hypothetical protein